MPGYPSRQGLAGDRPNLRTGRSVGGRPAVAGGSVLAGEVLAAMAAGLGLGRLVPGLGDVLATVTVTRVSLPIALGLLVMMYPVLLRSATTASIPSPATGACSSPHWC